MEALKVFTIIYLKSSYVSHVESMMKDEEQIPFEWYKKDIAAIDFATIERLEEITKIEGRKDITEVFFKSGNPTCYVISTFNEMFQLWHEYRSWKNKDSLLNHLQ